MKKTVKVIATLLIVIVAMGTTSLEAKEGKIKVNGICGMCKNKIEKTAKAIKGVRTAVWDAKTRDLTVNYNEKLTDIDRISEAVAKIGYDAGDIKANKDAKTKITLHILQIRDVQNNVNRQNSKSTGNINIS